MDKRILLASAIAVMTAGAATTASAATITPDVLIIESNKNRADGAAAGDVSMAEDLGDLTGLIGGIAGRIVNSTDTFTFSSDNAFNVDFVNLLDLFGVDIDGCEGFDGGDCSVDSANNEVGRLARFTLSGGGSTMSEEFVSTVAKGTSIFSNVGPGSYTLKIKGISTSSNFPNSGSAYDIAISPVPLPAGLPMLLAALGLGGLMARRKKA